jgi:uncharacterized protein YbgA (DUF1722 family)
VVAGAGRRPRVLAAAEYRELFCAALAGTATRGHHANALLHAFSQVSDVLDDTGRRDLADRIEAYRRGDTPLSVPVALLAQHARGEGLGWLAGQTYLAPYPAELTPGRGAGREPGRG